MVADSWSAAVVRSPAATVRIASPPRSSRSAVSSRTSSTAKRYQPLPLRITDSAGGVPSGSSTLRSELTCVGSTLPPPAGGCGPHTASSSRS